MNKRKTAIISIIIISLIGIGAYNEFRDGTKKHDALYSSNPSSSINTESAVSSSIPECKHSWLEPTCTTPRVCSKCGATRGSGLGHNYEGATCVDDGACTRCGDKEPALGHKWINADCTTPKTCSICKATEGKALGHTTESGTCERCGITVFKPIKYTGHGDDVISNVKIPVGDYKATITHNGDRHFHVKFYYGDGEYDYVLLANQSDPYSGITLLKGGDNAAVENGFFEVVGDGDWTILIEKISGNSTTNIEGHGDTITGIINGTGKREAIKITHDGDRHFHVKLRELNGGKYSYELLANTSDPYSGTVLASLAAGTEYYFEIIGDGNWTIDFGKSDKLTSYK